MKNAHFPLVLLFTVVVYCFGFSQQHSNCPNVLDESVQIYLPKYAPEACEFNDYGQCIRSFPRIPLLSERLYFFDTRFRTLGVELIWQSKASFKSKIFEVLRSKDGELFQKIGEINSDDFEDGIISFQDNLPWLGNNHYLLCSKEEAQTLISNVQSVYVSLGLCQLETMDLENENDDLNLKYFVDHSGIFQILVTDTNGHEHLRKNVAIKNGSNDIKVSIPTNGIYFVTLTNGFSSVTDLFVQSQGSIDSRATVANTETEKEDD